MITETGTSDEGTDSAKQMDEDQEDLNATQNTDISDASLATKEKDQTLEHKKPKEIPGDVMVDQGKKMRNDNPDTGDQDELMEGNDNEDVEEEQWSPSKISMETVAQKIGILSQKNSPIA